MKKNHLSRRRFLAKSSSAALALSVGLTACDSGGSPMVDTDPPDTSGPPADDGIQIAGNVITINTGVGLGARLANPGGFLIISGARVIVLNVSGEFRAFTAVCTHEGCSVSDFVGSRIKCPCHGSEFNNNGTVARGPASSPLERFDVTVSGTTVTVTT